MAKKNFEDALAQLETITQALEEGDLSLEDALKKFDEGVKLTELCSKKLEEAQKKVDILLKKDGPLLETPFSESENSGAEGWSDSFLGNPLQQE